MPPTWSKEDLAKILTATEENLMPEHMEARITIVEDGMEELRRMFKEHIIAEEASFKSINQSIMSLTSELHTTNSLIREGGITHQANTDKCAANLRKEILTEVYAVFEKKSENHNKDIERVIATMDSRLAEQGRRIGDNERKLISLWDAHEITKKLQYVVMAAVVGAILKAAGIM